MKVFDHYNPTEQEIQERIENITGIYDSAKRQEVLREILGLIDLTTLEGSDTDEKVRELCQKALSFPVRKKGLPTAAAVCVYPSLVRTAVSAIGNKAVRVASVAGGFPSGQTSLHVKLDEVRYAIDEGADEIDTVISRGKLLAGHDNEVYDEISAIKEVCGIIHLKVILETGELRSIEMIRRASEIAILAGADFIKTSTGKVPEGATLRSFLIMAETVEEYMRKTGKAIGLKPAGGIRKADEAIKYYQLVEGILGSQWLCSDYFRIGASSLADDLLNEIV